MIDIEKFKLSPDLDLLDDNYFKKVVEEKKIQAWIKSNIEKESTTTIAKYYSVNNERVVFWIKAVDYAIRISDEWYFGLTSQAKYKLEMLFPKINSKDELKMLIEQGHLSPAKKYKDHDSVFQDSVILITDHQFRSYCCITGIDPEPYLLEIEKQKQERKSNRKPIKIIRKAIELLEKYGYKVTPPNN